MNQRQRYRVMQWDESKSVIEVHDKRTGFSREFNFSDFYDGSVKGGGCEYAAKLPAYVFRKAYSIIDAHSRRRAQPKHY